MNSTAQKPAMQASKPVINVDELDYVHTSKGDVFEERYAVVSDKIGAKKLGYSISLVPPGKRVCPYHNHHVNEEMFFILEGTGTYRFNDQEYPVRPGDFCAAPPGGRETAHHLINTGNVDLKYIALSTMEEPEICEQPDSDKFMMFSKVRHDDKTRMRYIGRMKNALDYFDGEKV
jgi:uncharacterized cupin superfamily protein